MNILSKNSALKFLPKEMKLEQLLIFDALRITVEIIEYNYSCLEKRLKELSQIDGKKEGESVIFSHAWNIIDATSKFIKIYKELPSTSEYEILNSINHVNKFRNTFQHLNERINESVLPTNSPIYGALIWFHENSHTKESTPIMLISGINYGSEISFRIPPKSNNGKEINHIFLQTVDKKGIISTDITEIILELQNICNQNELILEQFCRNNGFAYTDWSSRKDIMIAVKYEQND